MSFKELIGKITLIGMLRVAAVFLLSVVIAYAAASVFQSLCVLAALEKIGADIPAALWWQTIGHDLIGLTAGKYVSYALSVLTGFVIAMPVAFLIEFLSGLPGRVLYPLAGAVAMAVILYVGRLNFFDVSMFSGTRGWLGNALQSLAGAMGGWVFAVFFKQKNELT